MVDQNPAHHLRGHPKEMRSILPVDLPLVHQTQIYLVHQRGRLEGVADSLSGQLARRDTAKLRIDSRQQLSQCVAVAATPVSEERGHVGGRGHQLHSGSEIIERRRAITRKIHPD
jgi:hypothetical protein